MMTETDKSIVLPALPLKNNVLFPHLIMPLAVGRAGSVAAVEAAVASEDKTLAIFTQRDPSVDQPGREQLYDVGTLAVIKRMDRSNDMVHVIVQGAHRIKLQSVEVAFPRADQLRFAGAEIDHGGRFR